MRYTLYAIPLFLSGCMLATQQDMQKVGGDVTRVQKAQVDLITKMNELNGNLETLNSQLESSQQRMNSLSQKMDDLQADIARRVSVLSNQVTGSGAPVSSSPSDAYRLATNDYNAGKYELAIVGFRNFVNTFPKSEKAAEAQFQIGECEFAKRRFSEAAAEYERVLQNYPKQEFTPRALYKKGIALEQAKRVTESKETFRRFLKEYPKHDLASSAKDHLN